MAVVAASRVALGAIIEVLSERGHRVVGPIVRDGTLALDHIAAEHDLPTGVVLDHAPGRSRLGRTDGSQHFAWAPTPSWKRTLQPPEVEVLRVGRRASSGNASGLDLVVAPTAPGTEPLALLGVRDCDLRAIEILDRVLAVDGRSDPDWVERRRGLFVVAVTCGVPASTCWCTTTGGSPLPERFDIRLTELDLAGLDLAGLDLAGLDLAGLDLAGLDLAGLDLAGLDLAGTGPPGVDPDPSVLLESGSAAGEAVLDEVAGRIATTPSTSEHLELAGRIADRARAVLDARAACLDLAEMRSHADEIDRHPHWDEVASRCVACGNCTSVCPTCFCVSLLDDTGLPNAGSGDGPGRPLLMGGVRRRTWASCFELEHSVLGGRAVRATRAARYRQWLTHKLITWDAQFGTPGCVGCGRCSIACPVGIDLPAEAAAVSVGAP